MQTSRSYRPLSLLVGLAFFMEQLDSTIIAPAIPEIAGAFGVSSLSLNLTMTLYLLCSVAFIPTSGHLAARWGTRSVFRGALILFVLSSVLCAMAPNLPSLAAARALQGVAAALMVPVGRMAIVHTTPRADLVVALAWMITPAMLGPLLGPPLGGLITTWLSWHWIFLINVPIGLVGYWVAGRAMPQIRHPLQGRFDGWAWTFVALVLAGVIAALEWARHGRLDATTLPIGAALAVVMAVLVWAYRRRSRRSATPMLEFALLSVPTFRTSFWAGSLVRVGYGALPFLLPLMLQIGLGFSALQSGLALLASGAVAFVTKTQTAGMLRRWGFRRVLIVNGILCAAGLGVCAFFQASWGLTAIAVAVSVAGFFRSIQFNALAAIAYADLPPQKVAPATTLNTMGQQLAVMLGISLSALVVDHAARWGGRVDPSASDFALAFAMIALVALAAVPQCLHLKADSGSELSGHRASA
ncbi:MAG TPA: MFS transporter [Burkholderiaceae bacterium]